MEIMTPGNKINSLSSDGLWNSITHFSYDLEESIIFAACSRRQREIFRENCKWWTDNEKVRLSLHKLASAEHKKYSKFILPTKTNENAFIMETFELL